MAKTFHNLTTGVNKPSNQSHAAQGKPSFRVMTGETNAKAKTASMPGKVKRASGPHPSVKTGPNLPGRTRQTTGESLNPINKRNQKY